MTRFRTFFAESLDHPILLVILMILVIGLLYFNRVSFGQLEQKVDRNTFAMCQALNDARDRAFASLATSPIQQGVAVGKLNRTMTLLDCAAQGYPEKFHVVP